MRLIDADEPLKYIEENNTEREWVVNKYNADWIWSFIDSAPTIDAEPVRHGHWKEKRKYEVGAAVDDDGWVELEEFCSVCGKWVKTQWRSPLYCPNCGAKMDEVSE